MSILKSADMLDFVNRLADKLNQAIIRDFQKAWQTFNASYIITIVR